MIISSPTHVSNVFCAGYLLQVINACVTQTRLMHQRFLIPTGTPLLFEEGCRLLVSSNNSLFRCTHLRNSRILFLNHSFSEK